MRRMVRASFTKGDLVTYKAHPEWNAGLIRTVEPNGTFLVDFEIDGQPYSDDFHPMELLPTRPANPKQVTQTGLPGKP